MPTHAARYSIKECLPDDPIDDATPASMPAAISSAPTSCMSTAVTQSATLSCASTGCSVRRRRRSISDRLGVIVEHRSSIRPSVRKPGPLEGSPNEATHATVAWLTPGLWRIAVSDLGDVAPNSATAVMKITPPTFGPRPQHPGAVGTLVTCEVCVFSPFCHPDGSEQPAPYRRLLRLRPIPLPLTPSARR